jgi:hypothetical protein
MTPYHLQGEIYTLKMETISSFETLVTTNKTKRRHNPEGDYSNVDSPENLKYHIRVQVYKLSLAGLACSLVQ